MICRHPYRPFIPPGTRRLIVGTLPPPRFSLGELRPEDVDFYYGSCNSLLWQLLARIYGVELRSENSAAAVTERQELLEREGLGVCDMVESCSRQRVNASDPGMEDILLRDLLGLLERHPAVSTLIFTGGNSKNGPEYLFRRQLRTAGLHLFEVDAAVPRRYSFLFTGRAITTVSLTSPSPAANRAIGGNRLYKKRRRENSHYTTFDFRLEQYRRVFLEEDWEKKEVETRNRLGGK